ncbi:MAG: ATPase, T2SS/T4P/T4SS family [Candidatus Firestonebacteria bacterium]
MPIYKFKCENCEAAGKESITEKYFPEYDSIVNPKCPYCKKEMVQTSETSSLMDLLLGEKLITQEQLSDARDRQMGAKKPIHEVLVNMGFLTEEQLMSAASRAYNLPIVHLDDIKVDITVLEVFTYERVKRYGVFPLRKEKGELVVAMSDPLDLMALDDMQLLSKLTIRPVLSAKSDISRYIEEYYAVDDDIYDLVKNIDEDLKVESLEETGPGKGLFEENELGGDRSPSIKLTNFVLHEAVKSRASDIHVESYEDCVEVRFRIDGLLKSIMKLPPGIAKRLIARIKALSQMDIAETRKPQDGRSKVVIGNKKVDLRISTIPTHFGEKIVMRLLDYGEIRNTIESIGFQESELKLFKEAIKKPQGIVLVTGPTGSGKTSTIYAAINAVKNETVNIVTIEDPIEYLMGGVNQLQVNAAKDVTFAKGLRSILRQDPNVIFVGEIRDVETAEIAFKAALTGHLVFSTLHTNNAVASIMRLQDMGLDQHIIASSIICVIAQRLVRVICPHCKQAYNPAENMLEKFRVFIDKYNISEFYKGTGCERCRFMGYYGRTAIFEILKNDDSIQTMIGKKSTEKDILAEAKKGGFKTLSEAGVFKVSQGLTTLDEVERVSEIGWQEDAVKTDIAGSKTLKILVVDDEEDMRKVISKRLKDAGYEVLQAKTGKEALSYAFKEAISLIVMDVMMPEMDGIEATRKLRTNLQTASIPIIMLTAKRDKYSELEGIDAGADDYIAKPFDGDKLVARIKMLLRRVS